MPAPTSSILIPVVAAELRRVVQNESVLFESDTSGPLGVWNKDLCDALALGLEKFNAGCSAIIVDTTNRSLTGIISSTNLGNDIENFYKGYATSANLSFLNCIGVALQNGINTWAASARAFTTVGTPIPLSIVSGNEALLTSSAIISSIISCLQIDTTNFHSITSDMKNFGTGLGSALNAVYRQWKNLGIVATPGGPII